MGPPGENHLELPKKARIAVQGLPERSPLRKKVNWAEYEPILQDDFLNRVSRRSSEKKGERPEDRSIYGKKKVSGGGSTLYRQGKERGLRRERGADQIQVGWSARNNSRPTWGNGRRKRQFIRSHLAVQHPTSDHWRKVPKERSIREKGVSVGVDD